MVCFLGDLIYLRYDYHESDTILWVYAIVCILCNPLLMFQMQSPLEKLSQRGNSPIVCWQFYISLQRK